MEFKYIYEAVPSEKEGETGVFRSNFCKKNGGDLITLASKNRATTLYEVLQNSIQKYQNKNSLGYREILDIIEENKELERKVDGKVEKYSKTWKFYKLSEYKWITFNQLGSKLTNLSSGLHSLGLKPNDKVSFYAPSSHSWFMLSYACFYLNLTVATVYDTLGAEGLLHGINECESNTLFISSEQLPILKKVYKEANALKNVIYVGELKDKDKKEFSDLNFCSLEELEAIGKDKKVEPNPPSPDDVAVVMYTSGSTGNPKGVLLKHKNLVSHLAGIEKLAKDIIRPDDRVISFLPLAHILAYLLTSFCVNDGLEVGFASPRTLMDQSVRECRGDIYELKPTVLPGVPQVFDSIRKGILNKVNSSGNLMKNVFTYSLGLKGICRSWGIPSWWIDELIFKSIREAVGGRLRVSLCGGAPLSDEMRLFFHDAICEAFQGYGMTEVSGLASIVSPEDNVGSTVGQINPAIEFKLVDVPEGGYYASDLKGEIWMRGPCVTEGYFKNEKVTKETITSDGWLLSGDIGSINDLGQLSIIDRKKNLVKLANGEYIALEKLESKYRNSIYVQNICVCADSHHNKPVALIQANLAAVKHHLSQVGKGSINDLEDISDNKDIIKEIYNSCIEEGKNAGLSGAELLSGICLSSSEWTVENGFLTGAQKIKRRALQDEYKDQLNKLYQSQ
ncbi:long-chain-fatty-acid-CoA ligase-like protein [Neoconidiobolus thromboides FSU 785]|nr:long-chain-fatty-acid-CoA ligase-like protein [Neoconidiobolus thromboides FSU 785]